VPLETELIGAHEHESYHVFDICYHNTSDIAPTAITGDMHSINVNQRRRHLFERRHARRSVVIGRGRICPWLGTLAWSDQAATAP